MPGPSFGRIEGGEERWQIVGLIGATMLVPVAYTSWEQDDGDDRPDYIRTARNQSRKAKI